ncbi:hypothetical protein FGO68_gene9360 [Halteria grandinella]|uniref:Uncharacterized protein n=1 Tax=Halteria grandinella TaxID=5974 RepID=A0A8J8SZR3_HALGN|nr:hypothetical protein FGO68_gene9360 [Halteria grandinella]
MEALANINDQQKIQKGDLTKFFEFLKKRILLKGNPQKKAESIGTLINDKHPDYQHVVIVGIDWKGSIESCERIEKRLKNDSIYIARLLPLQKSPNSLKQHVQSLVKFVNDQPTMDDKSNLIKQFTEQDYYFNFIVSPEGVGVYISPDQCPEHRYIINGVQYVFWTYNGNEIAEAPQSSIKRFAIKYIAKYQTAYIGTFSVLLIIYIIYVLFLYLHFQR